MKDVRTSGVKLKTPKSVPPKQINVCSLFPPKALVALIVRIYMLLTLLTLLQIHLGGMAYDKNLQKGVKRRSIPPPMVVSFLCNATYNFVIHKGIKKFFPDDIDSPHLFCLSDSSGVPYEIEDKDTWSLSEFVHQTGQPPSKLRLYIMDFGKVDFQIHTIAFFV